MSPDPRDHLRAALETAAADPSGEIYDRPAALADWLWSHYIFPAPVIRPDGMHEYVSTACAHGEHARCRKVCKFCPSACSCSQCDHAEATVCPSACSEAHTYEGGCLLAPADACSAPLRTPATQARPTAWPEDGSVPWGGTGSDCPYCVQPEPPRPFLCQGHPVGTVAGPATGRERPRCPHCGLPHDLDGWPAEVCQRVRETGSIEAPAVADPATLIEETP